MGGHQSMQYPSAQFQSERFLNYLNNIRDKRKQRQFNAVQQENELQMLQATQGSHFGGGELGLPQINSPRGGGNDYSGELGNSLGP